MRALIQRVNKASVTINNEVVGKIDTGVLLLLGIEELDNEEDMTWLINKLINLRIFNDENEVMNLSLVDIKGAILLVSQFTLHASTKKGNRPSYLKAAKPAIAEEIYTRLHQKLLASFSGKVATGKFGADMIIDLQNNGPVTIMIDSKTRE
jgi:D-tyrosyl-tRNA(Tyr) deacylase